MAQGGGRVSQPEKVGEYLVNNYDILGHGFFGVVTTGTNVKGKTISAKRISLVEERKARKISDELLRLKNLRHHNVLEIFEIYRLQTVLWIMMEYCSNGDLEKLFDRLEPDLRQNTEIMLQIAQGIDYLQSKDIVHRDIKPANILVAQEKPVVVKLTDFDCSKFFDPDYETSCMSSNVGTPAFKAPEYFQRFEKGDTLYIAYYRNVDIYAAGLTFLAMLQGNERLAPRIETAEDKSEQFQPIGQLIAERVKYKRKPLDVLSSSKYDLNPINCKLREVIGEMTHSEPKYRLAATEVVHKIRDILLHYMKCTPCTPIKVASTIDVKVQQVHDIEMVYLGCCERLVVMETGLIVIWGMSDIRFPLAFQIFLQGSEGFKKVREVNVFCEHQAGVFLEPVKVKDQEFLAVSCGYCQKIRLYDMISEEVTTAFHDPEYHPGPMSVGDAGELYVLSLCRSYPVLKLNTQQIPFNEQRIVFESLQMGSVDHQTEYRRVGWSETLKKIGVGAVSGLVTGVSGLALGSGLLTGSALIAIGFWLNMNISKKHKIRLSITHIPAPHNLIVFKIVDMEQTKIFAVSSVTGEKKWEVRKELGLLPRPVGLFFSKIHQILLEVNDINNRILVLEPEDGAILQEIQLGEEIGVVIEAGIHQQKLIVLHTIDGKSKLSFFPIEYTKLDHSGAGQTT